jgi:hypothetical protein
MRPSAGNCAAGGANCSIRDLVKEAIANSHPIFEIWKNVSVIAMVRIFVFFYNTGCLKYISNMRGKKYIHRV